MHTKDVFMKVPHHISKKKQYSFVPLYLRMYTNTSNRNCTRATTTTSSCYCMILHEPKNQIKVQSQCSLCLNPNTFFVGF